MTDTAAGMQSISQLARLWSGQIWAGAKAWLRRDGVVILLYVLTTIVISYPLAFKLGGQWLALRDNDTYLKLWDSWWLQEHVFNGASLTFTDLLFHPNGLDLSYHSISWTVALLSLILGSVTDSITAYNLTILIALFGTAYAAYLLPGRSCGIVQPPG